ncbi:hypothetical protein ThvES_00002450 [Thiovulum sp. ES]|nr:hypothetical protein ThvES_00002450 [Thiovulum sp. ES]
MMINLSEEDKKLLFRGIDANLNRVKEGLRVLEDTNRFLFNNKEISTKLKELRHLATLPNSEQYLEFRDVENDSLRQTLESENKRIEISDILISNYKRVQESSRVLEEFFKLYSMENSEKFKQIRYEIYKLEKIQLSNLK